MTGNYFLGLVGSVVGLILFGLLVRLIWRNEANNKELATMKWAIDALRKDISSLEVEHERQTWEARRQLSREIEETSNGVAVSLKQLVLSTELRDVMQSVYDNAVADGRLPQRYEKTELNMESTSAAYAHAFPLQLTFCRLF
jgi:type II secretory pathway component PulJ